MDNNEAGLHGARLLPSIVDNYAATDPDKIHSFSYVSNVFQDRIDAVSYKSLACAINRAVRWLVDDVGATNQDIAFLGCSDLRSVIFLIASMKANNKILMLNCYTPKHETSQLLVDYGCKILLFTEYSESHVPHIATAKRVPLLKDLLADDYVTPVAYTKKYEESKSEVVAIVLTSGSTGRPKGIPITHERLAVLDATQSIGSHHGRPVLRYASNLGCTLKYVALDLAYMGGIDVGVACPIFEGRPIVVGPANIIPHELSPQQFATIMQQSGADSFISYPNVVEQLATDRDTSRILATLTDVGYIGGPLNDAIREKLVASTYVTPYIGSTEAGSFITHELPRSMSGYICLNSDKMGIHWEFVDDDLYEPVFRRRDSIARYQGIFCSFPGHDIWPMGDLYSKHATEPDVWKHEGRKDDTIVLNHGENIAPGALEQRLQTFQPVESALIVGNSRPALALLVKPRDAQKYQSDEDVISALWPAVNDINSIVGPLAKITKDRILLMKESKPVVKNKKGAISRKATVALYAREIDGLYSESQPSQPNMKNLTSSL